ncbi:hypothetical protein ILUMI_01297 [Ignelater luminosus]|uniref:Uncharacterized protein n=1 Tax=Ignelater luminosus TaxID=2038154 RepID=A0A8K0DEL8_IGNLU|nr:hypothetical protein ILUMI_01297 [Ignelater luminosus]
MQQQQLNEINDLQSKLKEIQGQLKQAISEKDNAFEHLKTQFLHLQVEKENLEKQMKATQGSHLQSESEINHLTKLNHELQRELEEVKAKRFSSLNNEDAQKLPETVSAKHSVSTNFSRQVDIGDSMYQIRDSQNHAVENKQQETSNVADLPSNADQHIQLGLEESNVPKSDKQLSYNQQLNNNEAFNNNENVLAAPNNGLLQELNQKSSSTTKTSVSNRAVSKASLDAVQPLNLPTVTPGSLKSKPSQESRIFNQDPHVLPLPFAHKKLPVGVVPVPKTPLEAGDESKNTVRKSEVEEKDIREDVNNAFPNRYRANLILNELANEDKAIEADKQEQINEVNKDGKSNLLKSDVGDKENNALEVFDPPLNDKEKGLEGDPFGLDEAHGDKLNIKQTQQKLFKQQMNGLALNGGKLNDGHKVYDGQDGVDYDKDVQNDMQLEENDPEGEDDDPEYADHIAQHKDPAVRN